MQHTKSKSKSKKRPDKPKRIPNKNLFPCFLKKTLNLYIPHYVKMVLEAYHQEVCHPDEPLSNTLEHLILDLIKKKQIQKDSPMFLPVREYRKAVELLPVLANMDKEGKTKLEKIHFTLEQGRV